MTKAKKRKLTKRDPREEPPVLTEDREQALARLLKPTDAASLKAEFDAVHKRGIDALKRRDYDAFSAAIRRERKIIEVLSAVVKRKHGK